MNELLAQITKDMEKADRGNKAASQRIRTGTIRLEKTAKLYRKESIAAEKKGGGKKPAKAKPAAKPAKKAAAKKAPAKKAPAKKAAKKKR